MKPHIAHAHREWKEKIHPGDVVIDATVGNGHDLFYLAQLLGGRGELIGYDIQKEALEKTKKRLSLLSAKEREIIQLKCQSHIQLDELNAKLIVYNLGYLPGGNKNFTTLTETTLQSLHAAMKVIEVGGVISLMCYPGHLEGAKEESALLHFLSNLPSLQWQISHHRWINAPHSPSWIAMQLLHRA